MIAAADFRLNQLERETALWKKIEAHLAERLQTLRVRNDGDLTADETARLRGQIKTMKEILAWSVDPPQISD